MAFSNNFTGRFWGLPILRIDMRLVLKLAFVLLAAGLVSACNTVPPMALADVQYMQADEPQYGTDIFGARRAAGESLPTPQGNQVVEIRTYNTISDAEGS
jgi:hypothetical protein